MRSRLQYYSFVTNNKLHCHSETLRILKYHSNHCHVRKRSTFGSDSAWSFSELEFGFTDINSPPQLSIHFHLSCIDVGWFHRFHSFRRYSKYCSTSCTYHIHNEQCSERNVLPLMVRNIYYESFLSNSIRRFSSSNRRLHCSINYRDIVCYFYKNLEPFQSDLFEHT